MDSKTYCVVMKELEEKEMAENLDQLLQMSDIHYKAWCENHILYFRNYSYDKRTKEDLTKLEKLQKEGIKFLSKNKDEKFGNETFGEIAERILYFLRRSQLE